MSSCVDCCVAMFRDSVIVDVADVDVLVSEGVSIYVVFSLMFCTIDRRSLSRICSFVRSWLAKDFT